jgi:hypothetical protein
MVMCVKWPLCVDYEGIAEFVHLKNNIKDDIKTLPL